MVHGPTRAKCLLGVDSVLDTAVEVGLIVLEGKTEVGQEVKYCGFLYNSQPVPCCKIPLRKRAKALSCLRYVRGSTLSARVSCLAWAVLMGLLHSLVPATQGNIGATYLRNLYDDLYGPGETKLPPTHMWFFLQDMEGSSLVDASVGGYATQGYLLPSPAQQLRDHWRHMGRWQRHRHGFYSAGAERRRRVPADGDDDGHLGRHRSSLLVQLERASYHQAHA